jgi:hypothetical protein
MALGIYIPTLGRPHKLQAVADNIKANTKGEFQLYWGVESHDRESILAAKDTGYPVIINEGEPTYSNTVQTIYEQTDEPIFFLGNDDFFFVKDWDVIPLEKFAADDDLHVLGVHDGNPKTSYTSIFFIRRKYIEEQSGVVDIPNRVLYPYNHNFVDNEMTETAKHRGVWGNSEAPCILHQHPSFTWLGEFPVDETYLNNNKKDAEDNELFHSRRHLWQ